MDLPSVSSLGRLVAFAIEHVASVAGVHFRLAQ
jgi:hypothetical protein